MLLQTKFIAPAYNSKSVPRHRLLDRLPPRNGRKLILIAAPAGYGKTTLTLQWLQAQEHSSCWLSLDEHDNKQVRFWQYFVGTIATAIPGFGQEANKFLASDPHPEAAATAIVNELAVWTSQGNKLSIVLDDFHVIDDQDILNQFSYFIDFLPPGIEIVLTCRFEPQVPISRWSVKNWVDGIYASDLMFSLDESKSFFTQYMELDLSEQQIEEIYKKTEGWIAAMQLTALSASSVETTQQSKINTDLLLADDRHFSDYVVTEILEHQSSEIREFLLDTSCLLRLNADLCDQVRGKSDSSELLNKLYDSNLFIIPQDKDHSWFRYHDMFRDSLLKKALSLDSNSLRERQIIAINWLIDKGQTIEAIEQLLHLKDWELLAEVLEEHGNNLIHGGHNLPFLNWISFLPPEYIDESPRLMMLNIWALFFSNKIELIQPLLDRLESLIDDQRLDNVETTTNALIDLHSEISLIRSYLARSQQDLRSASALTQQVLKELDHTNMPLKSVTYYGIGIDSFTVGDLQSAEQALVAAIEHGKREKKFATILSSSGLLGWIYFYQGKLSQALENSLDVQKLIDSHHVVNQPRLLSCWQNSILALSYIERSEFTIAESYINPLLKHIEAGTEPSLHILIRYSWAFYYFSKHQFVDAIECLDDALQVYEQRKDALVSEPPSLSALKARCLIGMGKLESAETLLNSLDEQTINAIPLNFEDINLAKARIFTAQSNFDFAINILNRLIEQTRNNGHTYHLMQALILKAIACYKQKQEGPAQKAIEEAIRLAARDDFLSVFTNESKEASQVIGLCKDPTIPDAYLQKLSKALGLHSSSAQTQTELPGAAALESNIQLLEPLSQRELEVLTKINEGLANKEIAQKLDLAPATVKAHIRNLYGKINAKSRTEALSKARQLGLIQ